MTNVIVSGPTDFNLETVAINYNGIWLNRVILPKKKDQEVNLKFVKIKCCQQNTFMIDINQHIWGFGESLYGQLGERIISIKNPINISKIMNTLFLKIDGGTDYVIGYSTTKQLYIWGNLTNLKFGQLLKNERFSFQNNTQGKNYDIRGVNVTKYFNHQLQDDKSNPSSLHSTRRNSKLQIKYAVDIQDFSTYNNILYILTKDYELHSFGLQLQYSQQLSGISCGPNHVLAWQENGNVWSWGEFRDGKLGYMRFDIKDQLEPKLITDFTAKAISCVCGSNYSMALDVKGDIYTWGKGPFKIDLSRATLPSLVIKKKSPFIKIAAGLEHFGALNSAGQLFVWGSNKSKSIFHFPEEQFPPIQLEIDQRIIDFDMKQDFTAVIIQKENQLKLPLLNFEHFKTEQYKLMSEEASLIQAYVSKKNAIEYEKKKSEATSPIMTAQKEPELKAVLRKQKTLKASQSQILLSSKSLIPRVQKDIKLPIQFDNVYSQIQKMEQESQLYIPISYSKTDRLTKAQTQELFELDNIIQTDNDQLKYEYIQLVREKDEEGLLLQILNQAEEKKQDLQLKMPERVQINQFRNKFKIKKPIFHDKYDSLDKSILQSARESLMILNSERQRKVLEKKRQREMEYEKISQQSLVSLLPIQSKEQLLETIKIKAQEHQEKTKLVAIKKQEFEYERANHFSQIIYQKSQEYKQKQKQVQAYNQAKQQLFEEFLTFFNVQNFFQICLEVSDHIFNERKNHFLQNISAKKIQHYFRKKYILAKILNQLNPTSRKVLKAFIVRYKIWLRIKRKQQRVRILHNYQLRNQLRIKVIEGLAKVKQSAFTIQRFCQWFNNSVSIQLSVLNYYWDEQLLKQFKFVQLDQEKEDIRACQCPISKQIQQEFHYLNNELLPQDQIVSLLKFKKKVVLNGQILRNFVSKQIQLKTDLSNSKSKALQQTNQILLPYTRFIENIALPSKFKIKQNYAQISQLNLMEDLTILECKVKQEVLFQYLVQQRQDYFRQMQKFYQSLNEFKDQNKALIGSIRIKTFSKLSTIELQYLKEMDIQDKLITQFKQQNSRKRSRNIQQLLEQTQKISFNKKQSIIYQINQLNEDQYPYPGLTFKIVEQLKKQEKPKLEMSMKPEKWSELFQEYFKEYRARSQKLITSEIKLTTSRIKSESPLKKRSQQI